MTRPDDEPFVEDSGDNKPGPITVLLILLILLAMLATLVAPLLQPGFRRQSTPTPTPLLLQEA